MMEHNTEKLLSAIGDVDAAYLEEALDFDAANAGRKRAARFPKLSAACVAVLVILGVSVTAFAVSRLPLSWRDIFSPEQTVIGDGDETPVVSQQQPTAAAEELHIRVEKVISDERALYLLYSVKANEGAVLDQSGQFADFELYFPGQMMSGAYVSSFLPRKEGVPENELEGVVYANWQPGSSANGLVMTFANWQEKRWFDDETIDFNVAKMVENAGENAKLPQCQQRFRNGTVRYYWQPGDADVQLPCGASMFNEDGSVNLKNNEQLKEVIDFYATMVKEGIFIEVNTWDEYIGTLSNQTVVGTIQGCWILSTVMSLQDQKGLWAMTNLPKLVKAEGATNYSSNGGSSWAIINGKDIDLALDFMQMYRNVEFYNEILPATSAIATYTPAKEGSNYTAGSEFFNGEPIFAEIVEFGAQTPSNITGPYYYDAREALGTAITNIILQGGDVDTELATAEDTVNFTMGF